ncbi:MAG: LPXTG cell wall anchor domain-containing protein [Motilibacteraceae bacterium]
MTRREALRAGLLLGTAAWAVPLAQAMSATPAAADTPSAPGRPGAPPQGGAEAQIAVPATGPLASTGSDGHEALLAAAGVTAVAAGATLVRRRRPARPVGRHRA